MSTNSEIRDVILSVDTVYDWGGGKTEGFLPPNFYIDRLTQALTQLLDKAYNSGYDDCLKEHAFDVQAKLNKGANK